MKTNNLLTYLLYALLGLLIIAAGYKACQMQETKKKKAAEELELQQTLRDLGYAQDDSTANGSSYVSDSTSSGVTSGGIVNEPTTTTATPPATTKPAEKPATTTTKAPATTTPAAKTLSSTSTAKGLAAVKGPGTGRWTVRAGTFSLMEGARRRLEQVIRLGYTGAEISKTSSGQAAVVVFRSNDKNAAIRVVDKLEEKGVDAAVFDRNK